MRAKILRGSRPAKREARLAALRQHDPEFAASVQRMLEAEQELPIIDVATVETLHNIMRTPRREGETDASDDLDEDPLPDLGPGLRVIRRLGRGATGAAYETKQLQPDRRVAVKVFRWSAHDPERRRAFEREASILGRMNHPHVAHIHALHTSPTGASYLIMEYVDGVPFDELLRIHSLTPLERLDVLIQVCRGVEHAHRQGVIHRDLKPGNILVGRGPDGWHAKIIDFGVARPYASTDLGANVANVGTLGYVAPECLTTARMAIDVRSDLFAVGVLTYRVFAGISATQVTLTDLLHPARHANVDTAALRSNLPVRWRRDIEAIVRRAMAADPEFRYRSAPELLADLERVRDGAPVLARSLSTTESVRWWLRRHPGAARAAVVAAFLAVISMGFIVHREVELRRRFADNREVVDRLVSEVFEKLHDVHGASEVQHELIDVLATSVDELRGVDPDDTRVQDLHARIALERGNMAHRDGDLVAAAALFTDARDTMRALFNGSGRADVEYGRFLAVAEVRVGDMVKEADGIAAAIDIYRHAESILGALHVLYPRHPGLLDDLAWSYERAATHALDRGDVADALFIAERRIKLIQQIEEIEGRSPRVLHSYVAALEAPARIKLVQEDLATALTFSGPAARTAAELRGKDAVNCVRGMCAVRAMAFHARLLMRSGDMTGSARWLDEALREGRRLDQHRFDVLVLLADIHSWRGALHTGSAELEAARAEDEACLDALARARAMRGLDSGRESHYQQLSAEREAPSSPAAEAEQPQFGEFVHK